MHIWKASRKNFTGKYYVCKGERIQVAEVFALIIIPLLICSGCSVNSDDNLQNDNTVAQSEENSSVIASETEQTDVWEKGYDLPVEDGIKNEAVEDCKAVMELVKDIYIQADKGTASNVVVSDETMCRMKDVIKGMGYPVTSSETYAVMENYEKMEQFLLNSRQGKSGSVLLYDVNYDGGIARELYTYDGMDMYVLWVRATWNGTDGVMITSVSYARIKEWSYTEKGYFCYELCVPEPPEVTEIVDGSTAIRVRPLTDECIELSKKCVLPLGYQGNNLLCSNWNTENMEKLDYNGMYQYLYAMKYEESFRPEDYSNGIPAEQFEHLITEYLPVTAEQIREWAVFDKENQTYAWARLGCMNYAPTYFGTSVPEVVAIQKNEDGTVTLTVEAVCDMVIYNDAVITHKLTVRFVKDGSFQYLGNEILNDGIKDIPGYQYRIQEK